MRGKLIEFGPKLNVEFCGPSQTFTCDLPVAQYHMYLKLIIHNLLSFVRSLDAYYVQ